MGLFLGGILSDQALSGCKLGSGASVCELGGVARRGLVDRFPCSMGRLSCVLCGRRRAFIPASW